MRSTLAPTVASVTLAASCLPLTEDSPAGLAETRPNVLVVITDDQGYGDIGAHGNGMIQTPNLDRLHSESVRLTDFHVDPTCSPSRSALMSGRYSTRTGVWHTIMGRSLMDPGEQTLAEIFGANGYRTGMFGKWHLGDNYPLRPQDQGFEHVVWHHGGGVGQGPDYWGNDYFDDTYEVNGQWRGFEGYCTDVWFQEAQAFIEEEDERPFFAYVSTNAPHGPYLVDEAYSKPYEDQGVARTMARFYGMITSIDENLGRLREHLPEDTLVLFLTDNGTAAGRAPGRNESEGAAWPGFNAGLRGQKGSEYEGGHRVPCFFHWPGGRVGGGRNLDRLTAHVDILPTLVELCGLDHRSARPIDGVSLAPALRGSDGGPTGRTLFVHSQRVERPKKWRKSAVMTEAWRLVNGVELYDIQADRAQTEDVAGENPDVVSMLRSAYESWWTTLEPVHGEYVRIGLGGAEDPVHLMSHDWHTQDRATPWHQNHVRSGTIASGPWAVEVEREGRYEVALYRWPPHLERPLGAVEARVATGPIEGTLGDGGGLDGQSAAVDPDALSARFELALPAGPTMLHTTLVRPDGKQHGAYHTTVRYLGE